MDGWIAAPLPIRYDTIYEVAAHSRPYSSHLSNRRNEVYHTVWYNSITPPGSCGCCCSEFRRIASKSKLHEQRGNRWAGKLGFGPLFGKSMSKTRTTEIKGGKSTSKSTVPVVQRQIWLSPNFWQFPPQLHNVGIHTLFTVSTEGHLNSDWMVRTIFSCVHIAHNT